VTTLAELARAVLAEPDPPSKARRAAAMARRWRTAPDLKPGNPSAPDRPARPAQPDLRPPRDMPKRGRGISLENRIALLHALAHIELNAVDLACDLIARFAAPALPREFYDDWVSVAEEEALHFDLLSGRLTDLGSFYGALPAHDGLWEAAENTAHNLMARLAVVPMVLEARGLDVTPAMIASMKKAQDAETVAILERIYQDEIGHVAIGRRWFEHLCEKRGLIAEDAWRELVRENFAGLLKPPFNHEAREAAGFLNREYETLDQSG